MSKDKYVRKEAERAGVSTEHLLTFYEVLPCECGKSKCKGWQLQWKFGARRRREAAACPDVQQTPDKRKGRFLKDQPRGQLS